MGKIVKYCTSCDEGFAEKFGFCPDCGAPLEAFEMSPVQSSTDSVSAESTPVAPESVDATPAAVEPEAAPVFLHTETEEAIQDEVIEEPWEEPASVNEAPVFYQTAPAYADEYLGSVEESTNWDYTHPDDDTFHVTVIQEKNVKQ